MKTVQICGKFSRNNWSGIENIIWNTARSMAASGNETVLMSTAALESPGDEFEDGVGVRRFPYFHPVLGLKRNEYSRLDLGNSNPCSWELFRALRSMRDCDLFHSHAPPRLSSMVRIAAAKTSTPYVLTYRGGLSAAGNGNSPPNKLNYGRLLDLYLRPGRLYKDAAGIICTTCEDYFEALRLFPGKLVEFIPNGVDIKRFSSGDAGQFRRACGIPESTTLILCVGRIDYQKNQRILVEMTRRLVNNHEDVHLTLIGRVCSEYYLEQLWRDIAEYNLDDHVTIIKGLPEDNPLLPGAYAAADLFILPSVSESFGGVVLEAWAARVPVICSNAGGLSRLVTNGKTAMVFNDFSCDDLIAKYYAMKNNPELREQLRANAAAEVEEHYSWDNITARLLDFYQMALADQPHGKSAGHRNQK